MSLKTTVWHPDTCDCVIEYQWDTEQDENIRVHLYKGARKKCQFHENEQGSSHWNKVLDENKNKNKVLAAVEEGIPSMTEKVIKDNGDEVTQLKRGIKYKWSFDENRQLVVDFEGASQLEKNQLKSILDSKIGNGKVKIK